MKAKQTTIRTPTRGRPRGFTLVELLVVIVIITILISAVLVASTALIERSKVSNTRAVLLIVRDAIDEFEREQRARPTLASAKQAAAGGTVKYVDRYGYFPPDELEVFTSDGIPGSNFNQGSLAINGQKVFPDPKITPYGGMRFYVNGVVDADRFEHRDMAAMLLAIDMFSQAAAQKLSHIPKGNRTEGPVDPTTGKPTLFLDRGNTPLAWDADDLQVRYITDAWGVPIGYMAQRDWVAGLGGSADSNNHADWNRASTEMTRANGGRPIIFSYGSDGKEQYSRIWMEPNGAASLVADWADNGRISNPLNADNVYPDAALNEKLAVGGGEE